MQNYLEHIHFFLTTFIANLPLLFSCVVFLWAVQLLNQIMGGRLAVLGIYPRHLLGLLGVVLSPLIHANWQHVISNSVMLLILGAMVLMAGLTVFINATVIIVVISGLLTWIFGRPCLHIGASSLVMGYWGYVLIQAYHQPSAVTILVAAVCLYYFMGMFDNLRPQDKRVSWEGHVFGFIAGLVCPWMLKLLY